MTSDIEAHYLATQVAPWPKANSLIPISWTERVNNHDEEPLWARGWINDAGSDSLKGHGLWQHLEVLDLAAHQGYAVTKDATYDVSLGRLSGIAGQPFSPQTKARALYYGLHALAQHTTQTTKIVVQMDWRQTSSSLS